MDLVKEINKLKKERNAIILAHYYVNDEVQDIADFLGDSLALSQVAATTDADIILFAGVHFMAETAKILSPEKKVLLPVLEAGCSLADSCEATKFKAFIDKHPGATVISYVNTTAEVKSLTDIVCTSSNVIKIVNSVPKDQTIIFGPDKNLGTYAMKMTGRTDMLLWDGACHLHHEYSAVGIAKQKSDNPNVKLLAHPECCDDVLSIADVVGSTSLLLDYVQSCEDTKFIIATEKGILHQMRKLAPNKEFIVAAVREGDGEDYCRYMKMVNLQNIYDALNEDKHIIELPEELIAKARKSIVRMLELSK